MTHTRTFFETMRLGLARLQATTPIVAKDCKTVDYILTAESFDLANPTRLWVFQRYVQSLFERDVDRKRGPASQGSLRLFPEGSVKTELVRPPLGRKSGEVRPALQLRLTLPAAYKPDYDEIGFDMAKDRGSIRRWPHHKVPKLLQDSAAYQSGNVVFCGPFDVKELGAYQNLVEGIAVHHGILSPGRNALLEGNNSFALLHRDEFAALLEAERLPRGANIRPKNARDFADFKFTPGSRVHRFFRRDTDDGGKGR